MNQWQILKAFTERLFEQHKLVRRSLIFVWSVVGIVISIHLFIGIPDKITASVAAAYSSLTVFLAALLTFYTTSRGKDDNR